MDATRKAMATIAAVIVASLPLGCLGVKVNSAFDTRVDFTTYRSFCWMGAAREGLPDYLGRSVELALERELLARGFSPAPKESADLLVAFDSSMRRRIRADAIPTYGTFRTKIGGPGKETYLDTALSIDFVDRATNRLVWQGWANGFASDEEEADVVVPEVLRRIMEQWDERTHRVGG